MDLFERVLIERIDELAAIVADEAGLDGADARRFVLRAAPDLVASYRFQQADLADVDLASEQAIGCLLERMAGRDLAAEAGLSTQRTWVGLRAFVPVVVRDVARQIEVR